MDSFRMPAKELAAMMGISEQALRALAAQGIAKRDRKGYLVADTVHAYCGHLRGIASGRGGEEHVYELTAERARLAKEQADGHELKNRLARGELVQAVEVEARWADMLRAFRSRMLAVPSRVRVRLAHMTVTDVETMDREIRDALIELGGDGEDAGPVHDDA